jgi:predicted Zn-ribbon and HTH transcriptional regulator
LRNQDKEPRPPIVREETIRKSIVDLIEVQSLSAKEISGTVRISEKEVYEHLKHIQKTISQKNRKVKITAPRCKQCGFEFKKRERLKKPGKCPICKSETIKEASFFIQS